MEELQVVQVLSRTQRIVVNQDRSVSIINAGPPGPPGPPGVSGVALDDLSASGIVLTPLLVWTMNHGLGFKAAGWMFFNDSGELIEPVEISDITESVAVATWTTPVSGSWLAS